MRRILSEYESLYDDERPARFYAGINCQTRFLPSCADWKDDKEAMELARGVDPSLYEARRMALLFIAGIHASLTTAANPVIISIGGDSWACNIQRIHRFIREAPRFSLVIRFCVGRMLQFGLEEKYLVRCGSIWWGRYDSKAIERFLDH